jgi:hypothetical protein
MKICARQIGLVLIIILNCWFSTTANADSQLIDKVYHPYVLANERELEWRFSSRQSDTGNELAQRLGYGFSISETVAFEAYIIGNRGNNGNFALRSFEGEARWMITEQGQYWLDVGMLFELERDNNSNKWEYTSGIMLEKEFGKSSLTTNFFLFYDWGQDTESEIKSQVRAQYRYRWKEQLQPGIEFYTDDEFIGAGPAFIGLHRFSPFKRLKWEAAFILGFNGENQDNTFRFSIEYEY